MDWTIIIQLAANYGWPLAEALFKKWSSGNPPTQADFDELRALAGQTAQDRMKAILVKNGIVIDSDEGRKFLAFTQWQTP